MHFKDNIERFNPPKYTHTHTPLVKNKYKLKERSTAAAVGMNND